MPPAKGTRQSERIALFHLQNRFSAVSIKVMLGTTQVPRNSSVFAPCDCGAVFLAQPLLGSFARLQEGTSDSKASFIA
jgi:hypothetical protein